MKSTLLNTYRYGLGVLICLLATQRVNAQTETDALMIPKNYFCAAGIYTHNSWDHYWEGTFKRDNANLGTISSNIYAIGGNYGLSNRINLLFMIPYIKTNATAGTLRGQNGIQDLNLAFKWLAVKQEVGTGLLTLHAIASGNIPLGGYESDFLPLSLGTQTKSVAIRALVNYQVGRLFVAGAGQFVRKDNITIDRDAYYTNTMHYTNQVAMPNTSNFLISAGFRSLKFNAEGVVSKIVTNGGFDITKNNMPFPSNKMNATMVGGVFKYMFQNLTGLEFTAGGNYVVAGRNVGQNASLFGGVYYVFPVKREKTDK
jgi:hypothetical protein